MSTLSKTLLLFLLWLPRIFCCLIAVFISIFAMDVFGQNAGFWRTFLALLIHLIPTFLIIIILILSWKWPWIGGFSLIISGVLYIIWSAQTGRQYPVIYIPVLVVGILFLLSWFLRNEIKKAQAFYKGV